MNTAQEYNVEIYASHTDDVFEFNVSLTEEELNNLEALVQQSDGTLYRGAYHSLIVTVDTDTAHRLLNDLCVEAAVLDCQFCPDCDSFAPDAKACCAA